MTTTMELVSYGWLGWPELRELLSKTTALWLGPTEFCCGPLPAEQPLAHRIHAWDEDGTAWRVIPGPESLLLTALVPVDSKPTESPAQEVAVTVRPVTVWNDSFIGPGPLLSGQPLPAMDRLEFSAPAGGLVSTVSFLRPAASEV